jgi:hypothetical protein
MKQLSDFAIRSQTEAEIRNVDGIVYSINRWSDEHYFYKRIAIYDAGKDETHEWTEQVARNDSTESVAQQSSL